jgi:hypothetical protein
MQVFPLTLHDFYLGRFHINEISDLTEILICVTTLRNVSIMYVGESLYIVCGQIVLAVMYTCIQVLVTMNTIFHLLTINDYITVSFSKGCKDFVNFTLMWHIVYLNF